MVIVVVVWALAVAAIVAAALQLNAYREATLGRETLGRVQARWAARAGIERTISVLAYNVQNPNLEDAFAETYELESWSYDSFSTGSYTIGHTVNGVEWQGPQDEHAKPNINLLQFSQLINIPDMSYDAADAILDWVDADDEPRTQGAESEFYANRGYRYRPRNGPIRSVAELELIASCWPEYVRGEDWNLNGRLDPNEDDGDESWPPDNQDGLLDQGWSGMLTAHSRSGSLGGSGQPKLRVQDSDAATIQDRTGLSEQQATALKQYAATPNARLETLLMSDLGTLASGGNAAAGQSGSSTGKNVKSSSSNVALSTEQLKAVFRELTFDDPSVTGPGKLNINTVSVDVLRDVLGFDSRLADNIIGARDDRKEGFTSIVDLLEVPGMDPAVLSGLASMFDTVSNVFSICSRGTSPSGATSVEILVVVDRSTLPVQILEYREQ